MTTQEEILSINQHLKETPIENDYIALTEELNYCVGQLSRSGELLAFAQTAETKKRAEAYQDLIAKDGKMGATMLKELANALVANEHEVTTLADRLNSSLVHRIDAIRTQISYVKQDLANSRYHQ